MNREPKNTTDVSTATAKQAPPVQEMNNETKSKDATTKYSSQQAPPVQEMKGSSSDNESKSIAGEKSNMNNSSMDRNNSRMSEAGSMKPAKDIDEARHPEEQVNHVKDYKVKDNDKTHQQSDRL